MPRLHRRGGRARSAQQVGGDEVILGLSGGVDSSVAAALIHRAIGDQLTCVFVDHGLLRLDEGEQVMETFAKHLGVQGDPRRRERRSSSRRSPASPIPRASARSSAAMFVEVFQREAAKLPQRQVAGAGHDLSRRHRVGRREDQEGARRSRAPQRRRPAGDAAPEAARAAARAVQGRGARARASRSACRARWSTAIRSRARASACASSAK